MPLLMLLLLHERMNRIRPQCRIIRVIVDLTERQERIGVLIRALWLLLVGHVARGAKELLLRREMGRLLAIVLRVRRIGYRRAGIGRVVVGLECRVVGDGERWLRMLVRLWVKWGVDRGWSGDWERLRALGSRHRGVCGGWIG